MPAVRLTSHLVLYAAALFLSACAARHTTRAPDPPANAPFVLVLGIAQDAGYPQAACRKPCCRAAWTDPLRRRCVASLAIIDPASQQRWIIDATPDFRAQLHMLDRAAPPSSPSRCDLDGILLTHAHIGHYTGLQQLGREVIGDQAVPVYAMPRMRAFLERNGPWNLLVDERHIALRDLHADAPLALNPRITVTPIEVPHRDEYSETVGFRIDGPARRVLYIPDIDKWDRWERAIEDELAAADVAFLDGTFYANGEIPGRDMSEIPHPFIEQSMARFAHLPDADRAKIHFIHLNHTNPALHTRSAAHDAVRAAGFRIARQGQIVALDGPPTTPDAPGDRRR